MAQAYVDAKKQKLVNVRKRLFCDEQPDSPPSVSHSTTPISYCASFVDSPTIFFFGYSTRLHTSDPVEYRCGKCFASLYSIEEEEEIPTKYITSGERLAQGFIPDLTDFCCDCKCALYIVRPYDSSLLRFD